MKRLLWILPLLFASQAFAATTWYIRPDGGSNTQCTGKTNAAYPGSGTGVACAYNHPYQMLSYSGAWTTFAGGDTLQFVNTSGTSDTYFMGEQNGGVGTDWNAAIGGICPAPNSGSGSSSCVLPPVPSGTSGAHTKIIGQNSGSCHDSGHTHLVNPTILSGISSAFSVFQLWGTEYVDISCIAITQPDTCTTLSPSGGGHCASTSNSVNYGGIILNYFPGGHNQGAANLTLTDVATVGLAGTGIFGANLNVLSTDAVTWTDVYVIGNGNAGYGADSGGCGTSCEDVGHFDIHYSQFDWNGCIAVKPYDFTKADTANAFSACADQNTAGGNGDGLVTIASNNVALTVDHSFFRWNTQDGFDSLHLSDDPTHSPSIVITNSWSEGNEGATIKLGGGPVTTAINNVSISNCRVLGTASNFPLNPTGWNAALIGSPYLCRAAGDQWSFQMNNNTVITLENNTSVGYGTTMYDLECSAATGQTACATTSPGAKVIFTNNISKGYPDPGNSSRLASGFFYGTGVTNAVFSGGTSNNLWNTMFSTTGCPDSAISPTPTANQCGDPLLVGESNINAINPNLTGSSPAIAHGITISGITTDYNGATRPSPPAIGAFEFSGTGAVATPTALPVAGTYSSTQSVVLSTATAGATICFTTNGTTPAATTPGTCSTGTTYTTAISVSTTQTIMAIGTLVGDTNSSVATFVYTITPPTVATPTASPTAGTYSSTQSVALTTTTSGATICFTTNGTTPAATTPGTCSTGTTYTTAISVATSQTIMALGTKSGDTNSSVASFAYVIAPLVATPTCSPVAGTYSSAQTVTCSTVTSGATICGTTNGSTPTSSPAGTCSNGTSGPFTISTTSTLKAIGTKSGDTDSSVFSGLYTITGSPATNMSINGSITLRNTVVQ